MSWYPLQLFVRKWEVVIPIVVSLVVAIILCLVLTYKLQRVPQPVFLHYSVELGVDALGSPFFALLLPALLVVSTLVNAALANTLMLTNRTAALTLLWTLVPMMAAAWWFGMLIIRVNGA